MSICPRTGQPCPNPKPFTVTEITPSGTRQMQCCQVCITNQPGMTALPILPGLPNPLQNLQQLMKKINPAAQQAPPQPRVLPTCPACGINPVQIEQAGRFGCPNCYAAFKDDIESMLMRHHGAITHVGKVPKAWKARRDAEMAQSKETTVDRAVATVKRHTQVPLEERIKILQEKMAACVKVEDYEKAPLVRDVIKQMKAYVEQPASEQTSEPASEIPLAA